MRDEECLDISGIDRAELLAALYNATPALDGAIAATADLGRKMVPADVLDEWAHYAEYGVRLDQHELAVDYMRGRPIKVTLRGDTLVEPGGFDRNAGKGACRRVVTRLRMRVVQ